MLLQRQTPSFPAAEDEACHDVGDADKNMAAFDFEQESSVSDFIFGPHRQSLLNTWIWPRVVVFSVR